MSLATMASVASAADLGRAESRTSPRIAKLFLSKMKNAPVETLASLLVVPWLMSTVSRGAWKLLTDSQNRRFEVLKKANNDSVTEEQSGENVVKYRGKAFVQVETKDKVDLSFVGALPYWLPVCLIGLEGAMMMKHGVNYFKMRGYTPAQRSLVQLYVFAAILPFIDMVAGDDWANPSRDQQRGRRLAYRFRMPLYLWTAFEYLVTIATFRIILDSKNGLSTRSRAALFMQMALFNGVFGINVSHELLHKNNKFEKALAWALLTNVNYCHWFDEHEIGHHANVATPLDPATSREGETIYQFLPRTFVGSFKSSCQLETKRLAKLGITSWYTPQNRIIRGLVGSALWSLVLARISGSKWAIPLFYGQGLFAALLLEVVNYIEHFGLLRKQDPITGAYEPVDPRHSWNAPNRFSNTILFKLQRHSDHHTFPTRPYEILRNFEESPQLPCGYIGMFVLSFVPSAFFWIMNPLLDAHRLEYLSDRAPSEEELSKVRELKQLAQRRIWIWTYGSFGATTALAWFLNRRNKKA